MLNFAGDYWQNPQLEIPAFLCFYLKIARVAEIPTIIDQTSYRCNLGSR